MIVELCRHRTKPRHGGFIRLQTFLLLCSLMVIVQPSNGFTIADLPRKTWATADSAMPPDVPRGCAEVVLTSSPRRDSNLRFASGAGRQRRERQAVD
ncbi:MAG TPA: hypothetical protein VEW46_24995 [Pyrinomonadaceae bacterium]|nr:hypothetical protein [Pyrinomonadaceae bacterium]